MKRTTFEYYLDDDLLQRNTMKDSIIRYFARIFLSSILEMHYQSRSSIVIIFETMHVHSK